MAGRASHDDSDLEDLISKSPRAGKPRGNVEIDGGYTSSSPGMNPCFCITGLCQLCCYKCPCLSKCLMILMVFGLFAFLSYTVFSPTQKMGIMGADYSAITSAYDLSLSKVDHWCIQGDNDSCKCEDPLEPNSRSEFKSWNAAHKANVADVNMYRAVYGGEPSTIDVASGKPRPPIDVAFLGESVVEAMDGRWLGKRVARAINTQDGHEGPEQRNRPDIGKVFEKLFRKEKGSPVEGVALGIAGDTTANVLWRLQHDEMPYDFNPQVWWLVLGMNDLTRMQCSEEIVVLGILRIVEEIRLRKPDAKIVINSLLPMINYQRPGAPKMADFADFKKEKDKMRESIEIDTAVKKFRGEKVPERGGNNDDAGARKGLKERGGGRKLRSKQRKDMKHKNRGKHGGSGDNAQEGPELEEALERKEKMLAKTDKRVRDKVFKDDEKYHPKKPMSPFLPMIRKKVLPPVWPSVHVINAKLKEFCSKHESITFFDSTPIFASDTGRGGHQLHNELISPRGHPSELGFAVWEGHIMGKLHNLIIEKPKKRLPQEENPDVDILSPETEVSGDVDEVDGSGDGVEHLSDGKANEPPKPPTQPSRDEPPEKDENEEEEKEAVSKKRVPTKRVKEEEPSKDEEEEEEEKEAMSKKRVSTEKAKEEEPSEDKEEEEEKEVVSKKRVSTKRVKEEEPSEDEEEEEEKEVVSKRKKDSTKNVKEEEPSEDEEEEEEKEVVSKRMKDSTKKKPSEEEEDTEKEAFSREKKGPTKKVSLRQREEEEKEEDEDEEE